MSNDKLDPPPRLSGISIIIGFLIGAIITLLLIWIAYEARVFLFTYCANENTTCIGSDYYNDPGDALAAGANINDILFLNDQNFLFYKRLPVNQQCVPTANQTVQILYPQYCTFDTGVTTATGLQVQDGSNIYNLIGSGDIIVTDGNCTPVLGAVTGVPQIRWNSS